MKKWNMIIDVAKCENCNNCILTNKDEHVDNDFPGYAAPQPLHGHDWIRIERRVRGEGEMVDAAYLTITCNHCDNAPCINAAKDGAIFKRPDGIVIIDPVKAKGQKELVAACPYGAIYWNEELQLPQKWIFDAHLLDQGWKEPRWTQACPTGCAKAVNIEDEQMQVLVDKEGLEVLHPEFNTRPRVYYKNLHRFTKSFIGGSVATTSDSDDECLGGAKVALFKGDLQLEVLTTDYFGDFKFDKLDPDSGPYRVEISHPEYGSKSIEVSSVGDSRYLGLITI
jgi:Fe-S-cluster-containing dehydrogenase component